MKKFAIFATALFVAVACSDSKESNENENEDKVELGESYGPVEVDIEKAITVEEMLKQFEGKTEETEFTFVGEINEVCSKAGCWVNVDKGDGSTFMVRFKDHFTIPPKTDVGTEAYMHGVAYWDTVSVEMLQHFAEDAGKSQEEIDAITEPEYNLGFEADGITLKK